LNRIVTVGFLLACPAFAAESALVVDRGLPQVNLNTPSGDARSNIRWSWYDHGFIGDDFAVGQSGERWVIDAIRTWTVPGNQITDPQRLGDLYQDVRLYFGGPNGDLTPVTTVQLASGSDETSNPNVRMTEANATLPYDEFGRNLRIWQLDFERLHLTVDGGVRYRFGVWGMGRPNPDRPGKTFAWFNHASNAGLGATSQGGADGEMLLFDGAGRFAGTFHGGGAGWDKDSDINVQVFAHKLE
jgi:hypothetical protein